MALSGSEYMENGLVKTTGGALSVTVYSGGSASTYKKVNGFLVDADGRLVVVSA